MALLEATKVTKRFGGLTAVDQLDFTIEPGQMVSIIGPNGAGKTTFFNVLTGIYKCEEGTVLFDGSSGHAGRGLVGLRPDQIARKGISRTFQNIRLFGTMTVIDNILVGMHYHLKQTPVGALVKSRAFTDEESALLDRARELMAFVGLSECGRRDGLQPAVRRPAPGRDRPGAGLRPAPAPAGRTHRGDEPPRDRRGDQAVPAHPRRAGDHHPAHRA